MCARNTFTVYVHYPFCGTRCGYCSFPTTAPEVAPQAAYADAVLRELDARAGAYDAGALRSIYVGGGTPSLWRGEHLARVVGEIQGRFCHACEDVEVTVEANPGSLSRDGLDRALGAGVNRLSLGVQSLDDAVLALLGRAHSAAQARDAVSLARAAGVDNLGCDVIFGVPGQGLDHHLDELRCMTDLGPDHISTYGLTLSPKAPLSRSGHAPASGDEMALMMDHGRDALRAAGFEHYEVSNYCRPSRRSRHNSALWAGSPYLGLGAFAHSMLPDGPCTLRQRNPAPQRYMELLSGPEVHGRTSRPCHPPVVEVERVDEQGSRLEVLMLGLRTTAGVDRGHYRRRFGADPLEYHGEQIWALEREGLVRVEPDRLCPTDKGIWFADDLALRIQQDG